MRHLGDNTLLYTLLCIFIYYITSFTSPSPLVRDDTWSRKKTDRIMAAIRVGSGHTVDPMSCSCERNKKPSRQNKLVCTRHRYGRPQKTDDLEDDVVGCRHEKCLLSRKPTLKQCEGGREQYKRDVRSYTVYVDCCVHQGRNITPQLIPLSIHRWH